MLSELFIKICVWWNIWRDSVPMSKDIKRPSRDPPYWFWKVLASCVENDCWMQLWLPWLFYYWTHLKTLFPFFCCAMLANDSEPDFFVSILIDFASICIKPEDFYLINIRISLYASVHGTYTEETVGSNGVIKFIMLVKSEALTECLNRLWNWDFLIKIHFIFKTRKI